VSELSAGTGRGEARSARSAEDPAPARPRRKRVVLADSRAPVTVLRTVVELEEQTSYGEELVRQLIQTQFRTGLRLWGSAVAVLASLPALFYLVGSLTEYTLAGVSLPWLLLGILPYPLLFGVGYWYNVRAERNEREFVDMVGK
jgi:hypothetical protein